MRKLLLLVGLGLGLIAYSQNSVTRLLVVSNFDNSLRILDTATYAQIGIRTMTFNLGSFQGIHGLAKKPSTGIFYGVVNDGAGTKYLASVNVVTGSVTSIGTLGNNFSQLTFNGNNTLLGVSGSGGSPSSTVYRINVANAATSPITALNNSYGQVICYNPIDNRVYHWTGGNNVTYKSWDTSFVGSTTIPIGANTSEVTSAVYKTGNVFTTSDWDYNYRKIRAIGGSSLYTYYGGANYYPKGMAYVTCSRTIVASPSVICGGVVSATLTMSGVAGATYQWYKNNVAIPGATLISLSTPSVGWYNCRINDACGLDSLAAGKSLSVAPLPTVAINGSSIACGGQTIQLVGTNGGTSQWYQNGVIIPGANTNSYVVSAPGIYNMTKTNLNGCQDSASVGHIVVVAPNPTISVNSGSICNGSSFTMVPSGANTYTFEGGNAVVSPTTNTSYTVVGTSTAGCVSPTFAISNVTVNATPVITVNSGSVCVGNSFTMVPSGANTYTFEGGSAIVSPTANTSYTVAGTSTAGCVSQTFAISSITLNPLPSVSITASGTICLNEAVVLTANGADTYSWNTGALTQTITDSPLITTTYSAIGTSSLTGCTGTVSAIVVVDPCAGISKNYSNLNDVLIYPNPNKGSFIIELTANSRVTIFNLLGQEIFSDLFTTGKQNITIHDQPNGVYFLKIISGTVGKTIKLVKE